jgi:O-antigen biosynthesis protein
VDLDRNSQKIKFYNTFSSDSRVKIINSDESFNRSTLMNLGVDNSTGDVILFLSEYTRVASSDWLEEMLGWIQQDEIGGVGCELLKYDHTIMHSGVIIGLNGLADHPFSGANNDCMSLFGFVKWYRNYLAMTSDCMMIRRKLFEKMGGFNEQFASFGFDIELCSRMHKAGYRIVYTPFAKLKYHEVPKKIDRASRKDLKLLADNLRPYLESGDPYYNPNLSRLSLIPDIGMPGEKDMNTYIQEVLADESRS